MGLLLKSHVLSLPQNMAEVSNHHRWVYDHCYNGRRGLKETFCDRSCVGKSIRQANVEARF